MARYEFEDKKSFLSKLEEIVKSGAPKKKINTLTPYPVHEAEHLIDDSQSSVRWFQGAGAVAGLIFGFAFTIFTVFDWPSPMITGGKPLTSIPAFIVIAYEMTILFGCLAGFAGFLYLSRIPVLKNMFSKNIELSEKFIIEVED